VAWPGLPNDRVTPHPLVRSLKCNVGYVYYVPLFTGR
jgi:hypothetical protein